MSTVLGLYSNERLSPTISDDIDDLTTSSSTSTSSANSTLPSPPLSTTNMPSVPPGPDYYEERRRMWLGSANLDSDSHLHLPKRSEASSNNTNRSKLEILLARRHAGADEEAWRSGVKTVYEGLMSGGRLKRRLPLNTVVKVLKAGWMHDGTWPATLPDPVSSPQMNSTSYLPPM